MQLKTRLMLWMFLCIGGQVMSQSLMLKQEGVNWYLDHKVAPKENWYSIGRMYNISPREIAPFNNSDINQPLGIGQTLRIPLLDINLGLTGQPGTDEAFIPLYHLVKTKETLFTISKTYGKVTVDQIRSWNKLKGNETTAGAKFIVGFLKVKKDLSPLAGGGIVPPQVVANTEPTKAAAPVVQTAQATVTVKQNTNPSSEKLEEPPKSTPVTQVVKEEPTLVTTPVPVKSIPVAPGTEGAFMGLFLEQTKGKQIGGTKGLASYFKSTSGWKDGRYYVLMNNVPSGTIVRVSSTTNGKVIYAKVLGEIPAGKESEGLVCRVSSAALTQLQLPEGKFDVMVSY
ncbi:MAG: LysM peptidoglycan-binding domain-containing protein [Chitinophagaceae bacterium]